MIPDDAAWAVLYAQKFCIYAIPGRWQGRVYWIPRVEGGYDPDLGWLLDNRPTPYGWPSWSSCVLALGKHLEATQRDERNATTAARH